MNVKTVEITENLPGVDELLELLDGEDEIILLKDNEPVARFSRIPQVTRPARRIPGLHTGTTWVSDDFDDPLPDEFWLGES